MINVTENFITFCDDMMIAEENLTIDASKLESKYDTDKDKDYLQKVQKNFKTIVDELNKASKDVLPKFIEKMKSEYSSSKDPKTASYYKGKLDKVIDFEKKNKVAPTITKFDRNSDLVQVYFDGNYPSHDFELFYQDFVVSAIRGNAKLKQIGCSLSTEDYPGIFIHMK